MLSHTLLWSIIKLEFDSLLIGINLNMSIERITGFGNHILYSNSFTHSKICLLLFGKLNTLYFIRYTHTVSPQSYQFIRLRINGYESLERFSVFKSNVSQSSQITISRSIFLSSSENSTPIKGKSNCSSFFASDYSFLHQTSFQDYPKPSTAHGWYQLP